MSGGSLDLLLLLVHEERVRNAARTTRRARRAHTGQTRLGLAERRRRHLRFGLGTLAFGTPGLRLLRIVAGE